MSYFVTGATGFIGRRLVRELLARREGKIHLLVRGGSKKKIKTLRAYWQDEQNRIEVLTGDLTKPRLGLSAQKVRAMKGKVKHLFHVGAVYELGADASLQMQTNIEGTRQAAAVAQALDVDCFHLVSSIAVAGMYRGVFREDMFEEATGLEDPYFASKHESEGIIRYHYKGKYRIYRPGVVVGDSRTGEMDKVDGPYYFFKLIQRLRNAVPEWLPMIGVEGGRINIVPVEFVVRAIEHIAHKRGLDGQCFHLTDPNPRRVGDVMNIFAEAAHAPQMSMRIDARMFGFVPSYVRKGLASLQPVRRAKRAVLDDLGIPDEILTLINYPTKFDRTNTDKALRGSRIDVPDLKDYAWRLWDYWERHLDPDLFVDRTLAGNVKDRVVVVTGASSGIGKAVALKLGEAGAKVVLVARKARKLEQVRSEIEQVGGRAYCYSCDISDLERCDTLVKELQAEHGTVDVLINNAGRSIRRAVEHSYDRFHDFERTMQLNYFGALRITLGVLPKMVEQGRGHVINVSSIGVLSNAPRFSAYVASKAAMDAFSRCAASEYNHKGVAFTIVNMPLVRTPMIAPTKMYQNVPTISPEEAAVMITDAIVKKPQRVATRLGIFAEIAHLLAPRVVQIGMNTAFNMFPDSAAAVGRRGSTRYRPSPEQIALAQLTRGIHW